jgi:PBP1b-binding outer membrane lipoprotein LpoB
VKKFNFGILGIIGILILVVFASGCTSSSNNTNNQTSDGQSTQQSASSTGTPQIKVISSGPWDGAIADNSGTRSVQGSGTKTFALSQNPGAVSVNFQKDNSKDQVNNGTITPNTSTLTVQIIDASGNIVESQSTSADAGVASVSHGF